MEGKFRHGKSEGKLRRGGGPYLPFASAAAQGAPQATQCADRFHLLKNLGEALEDLLARHLSAARKHQVEVALEEQTPAWLPERTARCSQTSEALPSVYQQERMALYQQMIQLREQGMTQSAIAQQIGISLRTVQRWLGASAQYISLKPKGGKTRQESSESGIMPESKKKKPRSFRCTDYAK